MPHRQKLMMPPPEAMVRKDDFSMLQRYFAAASELARFRDAYATRSAPPTTTGRARAPFISSRGFIAISHGREGATPPPISPSRRRARHDAACRFK